MEGMISSYFLCNFFIESRTGAFLIMRTALFIVILFLSLSAGLSKCLNEL